MKKVVVTAFPLSAFILLIVLLFNGLFSDPSVRESAFIGRPVPTFNLPDLMVDGHRYQASVFNGQYSLINVWGTWCTTCKIELPYLQQLSQSGLKIIGVYYDQDTDPLFNKQSLDSLRREVTETLERFGDPFAFNIYDVNRELSFDLGVTGAPESFLINPEGVIVAHHIGDINPRVWRQVFASHIEPNIKGENQ